MSGSIVGGVDSSIPLQAGKGVQQPNPLQTIGQFANVQNALNQNKLFPGQLQQQGIATQGQQLALQKAQNAAAYQVGLPVVANPNFTLDDLTHTWGNAERNLGIVTQPALADVAGLSVAPNTPEWRQAVKNIIVSRSQTDPGAAVSSITPQAGPNIDTGPAVQPTTVSPPGATAPGVTAPAGSTFAKTLTPGEASQPVRVGVVPPGQPNAGAPVMAPLGSSPFANGGRYNVPAALRNPNAPPTAGGVVTDLGPAQKAALDAQGGRSGGAFADIADQNVQARAQTAILGNMLGDTAAFTPGPEKINDFKATLQRYAPSIAHAFGVSPESVSANESFDKLASQIASAVGDRSDASLAIAKKANPGSHLSAAGADLVIRSLQGFADYNQARAKLAAAYPNQQDRAGFEASVGASLDPRAFQFARMTGPQKTQYAATLSPADRTQVQNAYNSAVGQGLIGGQ